MARKRNIEYLARIKEKVEKGKGFYLTDFSGINVQDMTELRRKLRLEEIEYIVVKNRLLKMILQEIGYAQEDIDSLLRGPVGLAVGIRDGYEPARVLNRLPLRLKGALIGGEVFVDKRLDWLCELPTKGDLQGTIVSVLARPITGLAMVLNQLLGGLVIVLNGVKQRRSNDTKEEVIS